MEKTTGARGKEQINKSMKERKGRNNQRMRTETKEKKIKERKTREMKDERN